MTPRFHRRVASWAFVCISVGNVIGRSYGALVALGEEEIQEWGINPSSGGGIRCGGDGDPGIWIGVRVGRLAGRGAEGSEGDLTAKGIVAIGLGIGAAAPLGGDLAPGIVVVKFRSFRGQRGSAFPEAASAVEGGSRIASEGIVGERF